MNVRKSVKGIRIAAAIIDMIIVSFIVGIISGIITVPALIASDPSADKINTAYFIAGIFSAVFYFLYYTLLPYLFKGATFGKLMLGIRVVSADYGKASFWQLLIRNIFLVNQLVMIPITQTITTTNEQQMLTVNFSGGSIITNLIFYILYLVIFIMILATDEERGFHDLIGRTYVVDKNFSIEKLNQVNAMEIHGMEWAEFENTPNYYQPNTTDSTNDKIAILKDED